MNPGQRRALIETIASIPARERAWLQSGDVELYAYYGWGIVLNSAQVESMNDILSWEPGTFHVWRFANRVGKTTGSMLAHLYLTWKKWRYTNESPDDWRGYLYKTLHSAPSILLMGKAWEMADAWIAGNGAQQEYQVAGIRRRRSGLFVRSGIYTARSGKLPSGADGLWIDCANGSRVDFLSTHDGAGRMESDTWWFIVWDEFPRHQPVADVPLLIDQTFLPRSSDYMAPVVLSGTATAQADAVYDEIEEMSRSTATKWWNFKSFDRSANFAMSAESSERQMAMSFDKAAAQRSVMGGVGEGGSGVLFPTFVVSNMFDPDLPEKRVVADLPVLPLKRTWRVVQAFDHALSGDRNACLTAAAPWPPYDPRKAEEVRSWLRCRIELLELAVLKSSSSLTPAQQQAFLRTQYERHDPVVLVIDSTGEGGTFAYRTARAEGMRAVEMSFAGRLPNQHVTNKAYGTTALQKLASMGLEVDDDVQLAEPDPDQPFGLIRAPRAGPGFLRLHRQLSTLRVMDEGQKQDEAMTLVMLAWHLWRFYDRGPRANVTRFDIRAPRARRSKTTMRAYG